MTEINAEIQLAINETIAKYDKGQHDFREKVFEKLEPIGGLVAEVKNLRSAASTRDKIWTGVIIGLVGLFVWQPLAELLNK